MVVQTSNPHSEVVFLDSIDIDLSLLQGFQVLSVDPQHSGTENIPFVNQRTWSFQEAVLPGDEFEITFLLQPFVAGHFTDNIDVCNANYDWKSLYADVVVK